MPVSPGFTLYQICTGALRKRVAIIPVWAGVWNAKSVKNGVFLSDKNAFFSRFLLQKKAIWGRPSRLMAEGIVEIGFVVARQMFDEWIFQFDDIALFQLCALNGIQMALIPEFIKRTIFIGDF